MKFCRFISSAGGASVPRYGILEGEKVQEISATPWTEWSGTGRSFPRTSVRLLAPVEPRKIVCVGRNYAAHAAELGNDVPKEPMIFLKPNTSVIGPRDGIVYPEQTADLHFEGELAIVIGRICRDLPKERVNEVIFGYTIANDVTARDLQKTDGQWARAKGFDTFCPIGPWISTELDVSDLRVSTELNGEP